MPEQVAMVLITTYITRAQREALQQLALHTRVRQSDYIREAIADLLTKYGVQPVAEGPKGAAELELGEAAMRAGLSPRTLRRYLRTGHLVGRKVGGRWLVDATSLARRITQVT